MKVRSHVFTGISVPLVHTRVLLTHVLTHVRCQWQRSVSMFIFTYLQQSASTVHTGKCSGYECSRESGIFGACSYECLYNVKCLSLCLCLRLFCCTMEILCTASCSWGMGVHPGGRGWPCTPWRRRAGRGAAPRRWPDSYCGSVDRPSGHAGNTSFYVT